MKELKALGFDEGLAFCIIIGWEMHL